MRPEILEACRKAAEKKDKNDTNVTVDAELTIEVISA